MRFVALSVLLVLTACAPVATTQDQTSSEKVVVTGVRVVRSDAVSNCPPAPDPAALALQPLPIADNSLPASAGASSRKPVKVIPPNYPPCAEKMRVSGVVDFQFTLEADGSVGDLKVLQEVPAGFGFAHAA
jgi:outer membrane biosynthesis protein TonB